MAHTVYPCIKGSPNQFENDKISPIPFSFHWWGDQFDYILITRCTFKQLFLILLSISSLSQAIYSCFRGVEDHGRSSGLANPDLTSNYAQANMLKMLRTAKDLVSTANVESSLDNATKTIEQWSRHGSSLPVRVPQVTAETGLTYVTENHSLLPQLRSLTPPLTDVTSLKQQRSVARPTPLRYTLPARYSSCLYDQPLPVSSFSSPHLAGGGPLLHQHPHHYQTTGGLYADTHPRSPFIPYTELQLPDIYASHPVSYLSTQDQPVYEGSSRRKRRSKSFQSEDTGGERRKYRDHEKSAKNTTCLSELKANHLLDNHVLAPYTDSLYPGETYSTWHPEDLRLTGRRRHRRPSFLKATWGSERIRQRDESPSSPSPSSQSLTTLPDLFPCVLAQSATAKSYSATSSRNNLCVPHDQAYLHIRQDQRRPNGRKGQRLRYSQSTHLPTYGEAIRHGSGVGLGVVRRATSMLSRQYAHYLSSYPGLPLYHGPLDLQTHTQASGSHPNAVCQLLGCGGGRCGGQRGLLYQDSMYGAYGTYGVYQGSKGGSAAQLGQGTVGQPESSPCVLRPWRRVSSLESEV